jgi:hypothetical protein
VSSATVDACTETYVTGTVQPDGKLLVTDHSPGKHGIYSLWSGHIPDPNPMTIEEFVAEVESFKETWEDTYKELEAAQAS